MFSWKMPRFRYAWRYCFNDFNSRHRRIRHGGDHDVTEVRQASLRADRREFRIIHDNLVSCLTRSWKLVRPGFKFREIVIEPGARVLRGVTGRSVTGRWGTGRFG